MESELIKKLVKKFDETTLVVFSKKDSFDDVSTWIHSGSPELDFNLGTLGFPVGITEISGESKSGKTTLALHGMREFQLKHPEGVSIILSSENRDNKQYAKDIGVDTDKVLIIKSKMIEDLFYRLQLILNEISVLWKEENKQDKPKIFIYWDSLGGTLSRAEYDTFLKNVEIERKIQEGKQGLEYNNPKMADFAKKGKEMIKAILAQLYEKDIVFLILNHRYDRISNMPIIGSKTKSGGGKWVEYFSTLRLETIRTGWEKIDEVEVSQYTKVKVEKNDFGSRKSTTIEILLGQGIVLSEEDIEYALQKNIVKQEGKKKITFLGKMSWSSKREFYSLYIEKNPLLNLLHKKIISERHNDVLKIRKEN